MEAFATLDRIDSRSLAAEPPIQILTLTTLSAFSFEAGQYLEVLHPDGTAIPLSITSTPEQLPQLTLHYRSTPGNPEAERMDELLQGSRLRLRGGAGNIRLAADDDRPLLLIAGGTGISQALSLASAQAHRHPDTPVQLLACADDERDLYFDDLLPATPGFHCERVADARRDPSNRSLAWLRANAHRWGDAARVILSGSPEFVYAVTDVLVAQGRAEESLESDVYAWAPR